MAHLFNFIGTPNRCPVVNYFKKFEEEGRVNGMIIYGIKPVGNKSTKGEKCGHQQLVQTLRSNENELGNLYLKLGTIHNTFHQIITGHLSNARLQITTAYILMELAGL